MADWTSISNANVEPDAPWISATAFALRDNPIAIAEGALGAPRIQNAAFSNGEIGSEKLQSGTAERDWVLARLAVTPLGSVGSYAFLRIEVSDDDVILEGSTVSGSSLQYAGVNTGGIPESPTSPSGTWRLMGYIRGVNGAGINAVGSLWLRIS